MTSDIKTYSGYRGVIGILTSTHQTKEQVLRCMESCQGYPIWVHDNTNDTAHAERISKAVEGKCHYFSTSFSNGTPGYGKNMLMNHFGMDTNLRFFDYCFQIDSDDVWGTSMPELFKKQYTADFLMSSGDKIEWNGEVITAGKFDLTKKIIDHLGEDFKKVDLGTKELLDMQDMLSKFYKHPEDKFGTLNKVIGFHKGSYHKLKFVDDIRMGEDLIFMVDAIMANKRKELNLQYIHDDDLYTYKINDKGMYMYNMTRPKSKWLAIFRSHLPKKVPNNIHKHKVEWI